MIKIYKVEVRMIKISIIVPIYNVEKQLERCIKSLLTQEDKDLQTEIILVNEINLIKN